MPNNMRSKPKFKKAAAIVSYPIDDWKNAAKYPKNALDYLCPEFRRRVSDSKCKQESFIERIWRWEFMRRHPLYKSNWPMLETDYAAFNKMFGIAFVDPMPPTCSLNQYMFLPHQERKGPKVTVTIDWNNSERENRETFVRIFRELKPKGIKPMASRKRGKHNLPKYLRVLDAKASGATYAEIARTLELSSKELNSDEAANRGSRLYNQAIETQKSFMPIDSLPFH